MNIIYNDKRIKQELKEISTAFSELNTKVEDNAKAINNTVADLFQFKEVTLDWSITSNTQKSFTLTLEPPTGYSYAGLRDFNLGNNGISLTQFKKTAETTIRVALDNRFSSDVSGQATFVVIYKKDVLSIM